jgi:hypothetical protein
MRHYRAALSSDASASTMAAGAPGIACHTGCIRINLATFGMRNKFRPLPDLYPAS